MDIVNVICPACQAEDVDVSRFDSMMVLRPDFALFTVRCPHCGARISSLSPIPFVLRDEVRSVAREVHAGMGEKG